MTPDTWTLYGQTYQSRLLIGSALYPSPSIMRDAIHESGAEIVTVSLRRQSPEQGGGESFWVFGVRVKIGVRWMYGDARACTSDALLPTSD